jgi:P4 family phage/plasmid primase-like protien
MSSFNKYLQRFSKNTDDAKSLTHLAFRGKGKYNVSNEHLSEFYKMYYEALMKDESMYIIEKINDTTKFAFFLDIEVPKKVDYNIKTNDIKVIIKNVNKCIEDMFEEISDKLDYIITRRNDNYHINYYNIIVNSLNAQRLSKSIINSLPNELKKLIDVSVYRTGLRLFGSKKSEVEITKEKENFKGNNYSSVYEIYDIELNELYDIHDTDFDKFIKLVIRRDNNTELQIVKSSFKDVFNEKNQVLIPMKGITNNSINSEISKLLNFIKDTNNEYLADYSFSIARIVATQNNQGILCHYVTLNDRLCPFMGREHRRDNSPLYVAISINGIFIKCYDQDCLKRKFPDEGFKLPQNFDSDYPELYLSMSTKYWKTDVNVTSEIKMLLEDSLSGSHYKIAKVIYNIYKSRFRIDDIKNPDWYEYDGVRWSKTHIMNILISEELQKYYKSIKISDQNSEIDSNDDDSKAKVENNMRNSLVDNIIAKLENVSFKKNIMTEMHYLFKSLEPNFLSKLDSNPYIIGFKNGIYDLQNCVFRTGDPKDYLTLSTGYDYIEYYPECQEIKDIYSFLSEIIPKRNVLDYLLKVLGRSLLGINDEHFYIFTGLSGANGKSTLINFLEYTLGDYLTAADVSLLTNNRALSSSASPDVIRLKGRRLVSFAEPEAGDVLKTGIIKSFSGGDSIIARELYKAPISFKLQASMFMCCNDLPAISSVDGGTTRRLRIIEFKSRFCDTPIKDNEFKIDPTIKEKIKNWRPYFMSILLHYYQLYNKEVKENGKIEEPNEVKIATNKYQADNDKFNDYITESIKEDSGFETLKNIYNNFMIWWSSNYSTTKTPDIKELRKSLKLKFGEEIEKFTKNGIKQVGFHIKLNQIIINENLDDDY